MVKYGRICSKVWSAFPNFGSPTQPIPEDTVSYLAFQVQNWLESIPPPLRWYDASSDVIASRSITSAERRLAALLYLRGNQLLILLNRHRVLSTGNIHADRQGAQRVVDLAVDSIRVLVELKEEGDIYARQQIAFNHFLLGALAVIFLAVCHARSTFGLQCKDSFYDAIELVRSLSVRSRASKRLWKSVKALQSDAQKLGLHRPRKRPRATSIEKDGAVSSQSIATPRRRTLADTELMQNSRRTPSLQGDGGIAIHYSEGTLQSPIDLVTGPDNLPDDLEKWYESWGMIADGSVGSDETGFAFDQSDFLLAQQDNQAELPFLFQELIRA